LIVPPSTVEVTFAVFVIVRPAVVEVGVPPPPPQLEVHPDGWTVTGTLELALPGVWFVLDALSPTTVLFTTVVPAVPLFTVACIASVAVELAGMSPIIQVPVELAYVPCDAVAFTKVRSAVGKVSVATTPVDVAGPKALTVNV
jgi:hypothetical protein